MRSPRATDDLFIPMPDSPHPSIRWAFTQRRGGVSRGVWSADPASAPGAQASGAAPSSSIGEELAASSASSAEAQAASSVASAEKQAASSASSTSSAGQASAEQPDGQGGGLNLGSNCGDEPADVQENRARVAARIGQPVSWLTQVHGCGVFEADGARAAGMSPSSLEADAQILTRPGLALAVLVADCLPVLLADRRGRVIGAAHAGWRGLAGGVLEATVARMLPHAGAGDLVAWLGPCIGPTAFEVGDEVRTAFVEQDAQAAAAFVPSGQPGKWLADLPALARRRLQALGIGQIVGGELCTYRDPARFWSYRRDKGRCGRMAGLIWFDQK